MSASDPYCPIHGQQICSCTPEQRWTAEVKADFFGKEAKRLLRERNEALAKLYKECKYRPGHQDCFCGLNHEQMEAGNIMRKIDIDEAVEELYEQAGITIQFRVVVLEDDFVLSQKFFERVEKEEAFQYYREQCSKTHQYVAIYEKNSDGSCYRCSASL